MHVSFNGFRRALWPAGTGGMRTMSVRLSGQLDLLCNLISVLASFLDIKFEEKKWKLHAWCSRHSGIFIFLVNYYTQQNDPSQFKRNKSTSSYSFMLVYYEFFCLKIHTPFFILFFLVDNQWETVAQITNYNYLLASCVIYFSFELGN